MAGLFFCLASSEGAGLLFCPAAIQPNTSVYSAFCAVHAVYTTSAAKQRAGLYGGISCDLTHSTTCDTRPTQAAIIPPVPRRTLYRPAQPPYYNKVYKGARVRPCYGSMPNSAAYRRPCQPGGVSVSTCTGSARRLAIWHQSAARAHRLEPSTRRAVRQQGRGGRRGTIDGCRRISFRAFAR